MIKDVEGWRLEVIAFGGLRLVVGGLRLKKMFEVGG